MKNSKIWMAVAGMLMAVSLFFSFSSRKDIGAAGTAVMVAEWERAKAYTKEYLDAATEESLKLKPKPEMRSLAEQMLHLAGANFGIVGGFTGKESPYRDLEKMEQFKTKEALTKVVMESYDFVIARLKEQTDASLAEKVKLFNTFEMTRELAFAKIFEHQTHHRGQATVYLRLAGITPPNEKLF